MKNINFYRFPIEKDLNQLWIDAINRNNSEGNKVNGHGFLCHLHFMESDLTKVKGVLKLKLRAVPVKFNFLGDNSEDTEHAKNINPKHIAPNIGSEPIKNCNKCSALRLELNDSKQMLFQSKINSELDCTKNNEKIKKLTRENFDLKEKVRSSEKKKNESESKIKMLEKQLRCMNATAATSDVICSNDSVKPFRIFHDCINIQCLFHRVQIKTMSSNV